MNNPKYRKHNRRRKRKSGVMYFAFFCIIAAVCLFIAVHLGKRLTAYGEKNTGNIGESGNTENEEKGTKKHIIAMEGLSQEDIPTGCESVSAVAVLNYYGVNITPRYFIMNYLPMEGFYKKNGKVYGANPREAFAGNPYEAGSLGCYCEVIEAACVSMAESNYRGTENLKVKSIEGIPLLQLAETYVLEDKPVIIWATMDMKESYDGFAYYLESGEKYVWKAGEHCMVLCGYDDEKYYIMDPMKDGNIVGYEKALVEKRYKEMGQQAVIIEKED